MKTKSKRFLQITLAFLFTIGIFYVCIRQVNIDSLIKSLTLYPSPLYFFSFLASLSIVFLNTIQLKLFLPFYSRISHKTMFLLVAIFSMMVNLVPFYGGHALLIYLMGEKEKLGKTTALSVLTMDQISEGFGKLFIFAVTAFCMDLPAWLHHGIKIMLVIIIVGFSILWYLALHFKEMKPTQSEKVNYKKRFIQFLAHFSHNLHTLRDIKKTLAAIGLAALMKFMEVLVVFYVQKAFSMNLDLGTSFLVVTSLSLSTSIPLTPGRLGVYEATCMFVFQYQGIDPSDALAAGLLIHALHLAPFIITGYFASLKLGLQNRSHKSQSLLNS